MDDQQDNFMHGSMPPMQNNMSVFQANGNMMTSPAGSNPPMFSDATTAAAL